MDYFKNNDYITEVKIHCTCTNVEDDFPEVLVPIVVNSKAPPKLPAIKFMHRVDLPPEMVWFPLLHRFMFC